MHWGRRGPGRRNCDRCKTNLCSKQKQTWLVAASSTSVVHRHKGHAIAIRSAYISVLNVSNVTNPLQACPSYTVSATTLYWNQCYFEYGLKLMFNDYCDLLNIQRDSVHCPLDNWTPYDAGHPQRFIVIFRLKAQVLTHHCATYPVVVPTHNTSSKDKLTRLIKV